MMQAAELWRFFVGVLTGAALCTVLFGKVLSFGLRNSQSARNKLRVILDQIEGYPLVFCRTCGTFTSTAPADEDEDEGEHEDEHCLANSTCFVRKVHFEDGTFAERAGPVCYVCDEIMCDEIIGAN